MVVEQRELPARPLVLAAAGVTPNDPTNSHMAIAKLKALGFETRYDGQEHSGAAPVLTTTYAGKEFTHRELWKIVEEERQRANANERGWFAPSLVAMVFAFHTVEAYLNFIGEQLAPDVWKDERNFFRREPYRGFDGKLRKVLELVGLPNEATARPQKTIEELKTLRDLIAHGRSETLSGEIAHGQSEDPPLPISTLRAHVIPHSRLALVVSDVEKFLNSIHEKAAPLHEAVASWDDHNWFGSKALQGPSWYNARSTRLTEVQE